MSEIQQALEALRILADYATSFDDAVSEPMAVGAQAAHDTIKAVLEAVAKEQADWETLARWREGKHTATAVIALWRNGERPEGDSPFGFHGDDRLKFAVALAAAAARVRKELESNG